MQSCQHRHADTGAYRMDVFHREMSPYIMNKSRGLQLPAADNSRGQWKCFVEETRLAEHNIIILWDRSAVCKTQPASTCDPHNRDHMFTIIIYSIVIRANFITGGRGVARSCYTLSDERGTHRSFCRSG